MTVTNHKDGTVSIRINEELGDALNALAIGMDNKKTRAAAKVLRLASGMVNASKSTKAMYAPDINSALCEIYFGSPAKQ